MKLPWKILVAGIGLLLALSQSGCTPKQNEAVATIEADATAIASHLHPTGSISIDPVTGAITVTGSVDVKAMATATEISNQIIAHRSPVATKEFDFCKDEHSQRNFGRSSSDLILDKQFKPTTPTGHSLGRYKALNAQTRDACGNKSLTRVYVPYRSMWRGFITFPKCHDCTPIILAPVPVTPVVDTDVPAATPTGPTLSTTVTVPAVSPVLPDPGVTGTPAPVDTTGGLTDDQIIQAVTEATANNDADSRNATGDRIVVFGNNYPGTDAELHQCVNDALKNVVNLVRFDHINPSNIRLFTNEQCTKANYEKWVKWALVDGPIIGKHGFFNSSHGGEDTDQNGKIVDLLITDDMVRKNDWSPATEVTFDYWYALLRATDKNWIILNDSCHAGGQTKTALGLFNHGRQVRSLDGPPAAQARVAAAVSKSTAKADLGKLLTGTVFAACRADQLSSEGPNGGVGTNDWWAARKMLPAEAKTSDIVRQTNKIMIGDHETQNMVLIGVVGPLWTK